MEEVYHLHALVVVEFTLIEVAAAGTDALDGRQLSHIVIDFLQLAAYEVLHDAVHTSLTLAEEQRVDVVHHLLSMEHRRDAAGHDQLATLVILLGNLPAALYLGGEHHGQCHDVALLVEVDGFNILVGERHIDVVGQRARKSHRSVRRQVESRLPGEFLPLRVD